MKSKIITLTLLAGLSAPSFAGDFERVLGGVIIGAVIGSQIADSNRTYYYPPQPVYAPPPQVVYETPVYVYSPPPVVYAPAPVYYGGYENYPYNPGHQRHHRHHRHH